MAYRLLSLVPAKLTFPNPFNVAVPFIDRHVKENRAEQIVIECAHETVTYGVLSEKVNRCGSALLNQDIRPGDRLMMVVKDNKMISIKNYIRSIK